MKKHLGQLYAIFSNRFFLLCFLISIISCAKVSGLNDEIVQKTLTWNKLVTEQNLVELETMYTGSVLGYGVKSSTAEFMAAKAKFYEWAGGFTQTIISDFTIKKCDDGRIVCEFVKQSTFKGKTQDFQSYLVFEKRNGKYLITAEGDVVADRFNGYQLQLGGVKSVDVVSMNDFRTTSSAIPLTVGAAITLLFVFLTLFYRKRQKDRLLKTQTVQEQITVTGNQNSGPIQEELTKSKSEQELKKEKGDEFEKFVWRSFNPKYFDLIHWTSDKGVDGVYARSNQNPDLVVQLNLSEGSYRFAVECKWRAKLSGDNEIEICRSDQLDRYKTYGKKNKMEVFIALGIGGKPEYPEKLYIIPLKYVNHPVVKAYFLERYRKEPGSFFFYNTSNEMLT